MKSSNAICFLIFCFFPWSACDDSEIVKSITDSKGIIFEINLINPGTSTDYPWIGMTGYYPDGRVLFSGQDSIGIENFYPDGEYRIDSELISGQFKTKSAYEFKISGIVSSELHSFKMTFYSHDTVGTIKKIIIVEKDKNRYILK
jgi:hypothetical protein